MVEHFMFENILLLLLAYLIAGLLTYLSCRFDKKLEVWLQNHRYNMSLRKRINEIKEDNKKMALLALSVAIAETYKAHNNTPISYKFLKEMTYKEYEINKKLGVINDWNRFC